MEDLLNEAGVIPVAWKHGKDMLKLKRNLTMHKKTDKATPASGIGQDKFIYSLGKNTILDFNSVEGNIRTIDCEVLYCYHYY